MRILAISGSLRAASANTRIVEALALLAPPGIEVSVYGGLGTLPIFNLDLEDHLPAAVEELRHAVGASDGMVISSPEYAHGVAGGLKNALDWLVPSLEFPGIRAAVINAAPQSTYAGPQLQETLRVMSAVLVEAACVALPMAGRSEDPAGIAASPELAAPLRVVLESLSAVGRVWRVE